jgi:glycine/D-amino acid oxidase-like deaminating enzyme
MSTLSDTYDTVVVGAGLTGALVAHHLAEASQSVAVLEAKRAPGSPATRGPGVAFLGTPEPYATLQTRLGADQGRQVWKLTRRNLDMLTTILEKVHQQATPVGSLRITDDATEAALLQESSILLRQDLYAAEMDDDVGFANEVGKTNLTDYGYQAGLRTAEDLTFEPEALTAALLDHANITVEYETEVQAIRQAQRPADAAMLSIWARKHYLHAKNVILASGAHAARLCPSLAGIISPLSMQAIDLHTEAALPTPLIINRGQVVVEAHAEHWRMIGWSSAGKDAMPIIADVAQQLCPDAPVVGRHSWWAAQSADELPVVGPAPDMPNVYVVNGLGPFGWSWVCVAVDRLIGALLHDEKIGLLALDRFSED